MGYHAIFNPASDPKIAARLERAPGTSPEEMKASLREYHHHFVALKNIYGSGRKTMAQMLAKKYDLVPVHCGTLIRTEVLKGTKLGTAMSTYTEARLPVGQSYKSSFTARIRFSRQLASYCHFKMFPCIINLSAASHDVHSPTYDRFESPDSVLLKGRKEKERKDLLNTNLRSLAAYQSNSNSVIRI
ncbi:unnamed protein product [Dibothriocephalus latus]|uniref:Uncharacterized protein n=1 Tax=Dibothriocephalus latus TaxID=60516 RepID=A0A3P7L9A2_DIBLA|nr:unnamed protein product [Dibothriocephalus latus]